MQTLEQANESVANPRFAGPFRIYRLAFLITGDSERSLDMAIAALDSEEGASPFFSTWMLVWSRKVVIAKALAAVRDELAESARRTASKRLRGFVLPPRSWALNHDTTGVQLERALLAIDLFSRCALVLTVFERMSLEDAAILLDADRRLVLKGQRAGLRELTRNLARMQGGTSTVGKGYVVTSEMQHA